MPKSFIKRIGYSAIVTGVYADGLAPLDAVILQLSGSRINVPVGEYDG